MVRRTSCWAFSLVRSSNDRLPRRSSQFESKQWEYLPGLFTRFIKMSNNVAMKNSNSMSRVEQFLKFKRSQGSLASTFRSSKQEKDMQRRKQEQLQQLRQKNAHKQAQLEAYQREYQKLTEHVHDAIYHLKTEQDAVEREIESVRSQKEQQTSFMKNGGQRIEDLREQIDMNAADKVGRKKLFEEEQQKLNERIEQERKKSKELEKKVEQSQKWIWELHQKQEKEPGLGTVDLAALNSEIALLKTAGNAIVKEQASELKRFKKEVEEIKKLIKQSVEKSEEKTKGWTKKCELVLQGKKQFKDVLPESFYTEKWGQKSQQQIEAEYKNELQTIAQLYEADARKELGDILTPCTIKSQPLVIRQSFERYPVAELEEQIRKMEQDTKRMEAEMVQKDQETELFKSMLEKYDKDIDKLKLEIELKKRKK